MRQIIHVILLLLALLISRCTLATDIIGGSLRYEALGNQQYRIIGVVNRNCGGPALSTPTFKVYSGTTSYTLSATRTAIKDITAICSKATPPCNPSNTQTVQGQEQHTFEASVDFSQSPYNTFYTAGKCEVMFSMEACCRSAQTSNMTANDLFLEAMLNLCVLGTTGNNTNTSDNNFNYAEMCANLPFYYNLGMNDKDGDSLAHSIETPKKSKDSFEMFKGQFSTQFPMTPYCIPSGLSCTPLQNAKPPRGFYFDAHSGDFILTPTSINEGAVIDIRTSEYRKINNTYVLTGYSTTEVFAIVKACPDNNPPEISTVNKWSVCEGNKLCFTIKSTDTKTISQAQSDTTTLTWDFGIPAATFRIIDPSAREKEAEFCWQTKAGDAKSTPYRFRVYAKDDNCPNPGGIVKSFLVNVKPKAKAIREYRKLPGNQLKFNAYPEDSSAYTPTYEWQIRDTMGKPPLYVTFKQKDSFKFKDTGRYFITMTINNAPLNCPTVYIDTVYMNGSITASVPYTFTTALRVYPNPVSGLLKIELKPGVTYTGMHLFNALGQAVYSGPASSTLDMSRFPKGVYTLEIWAGKERSVISVIRE